MGIEAFQTNWLNCSIQLLKIYSLAQSDSCSDDAVVQFFLFIQSWKVSQCYHFNVPIHDWYSLPPLSCCHTTIDSTQSVTLSWLTGTLDRTEPSLILLVTPVLFLQRQVEIYADLICNACR